MANPWRTAVPDWEQRLLSGQSLVPSLPLFIDEADAALKVFKKLRIPDVPGTPRLGSAGGPWFFEIVEVMFGAFDEDLGKRWLQELFLMTPKKNAKSTNVAGLGVTAALRIKRPEAEIQILAPTKEIAGQSYGQARGMIKKDPVLDTMFHIQDNIKQITHIDTGRTLKIRAADVDTVTGTKSTVTIIDETHVFANISQAAAVFTEARGALAARPDGMLIQITTQSKDPPAGVFKAELERAREVRDGTLDYPMLAVLYELPHRLQKMDGEWKKRKYWPVLNPNLGRSVNLEFLERELSSKEREGPAALQLFASQHFNVEIGVGLNEETWPGAIYWDRRKDEAVTFEWLLDNCECVVFGADGGGLSDMFGFAAIGRHRLTRRWHGVFRAWMHQVAFDMRPINQPALLDFIREGTLVIVKEGEGNRDMNEAVEYVKRARSAGVLPEKLAVGVDTAGISDFVDALRRAEFDVSDEAKFVVGVPQGRYLKDAIDTLGRRLERGDFSHDGSQLMSWCVGNARQIMRGNANTITKETSRAKIDPLVAGFNATYLMARDPQAIGRSIYDDEELWKKAS